MVRLGKRLTSAAAHLAQRFHRNERGNTAMTFAFALLPLLAAVGLAVDGGRVFMVKSQLSSAVDVTALTATRLFLDTDRDRKAKEFFTANFTADLGGVKLNPVKIDASSAGATKSITVTASAVVPTLFMRLFGIRTVTVDESAKAARTDSPIELVMALDNTGSMALDIGGGVSRLAALKKAAETLLDSMFGAKENNPQIQIGIIPYTAYVNVGKLLEPGFVQPMPGYTDRPDTDALAWKGCVDADASNPDAPDDLTSSAWNTAWDTQDMRAGNPVKPSLYPSFRVSYNHYYPASSWSDPGESCVGFVSERKCDTRPSFSETKCVEGTCFSKEVINPDLNKCIDTTCEERAASSGANAASNPLESFRGHEYGTGGNDALFGRANPYPAGMTMEGTDITNYHYTIDPDWPAPLRYASRTTDRHEDLPQLVEPTSDNNDNEWEDIHQDTNGDGAAASPNTYCPQQALPLAAHSKTDLKNYINTQLKAFYPDWGTLSNQGLVWGWRMVSAAPPLRGQGAGSGFSKAVVLMTDGEMYHHGGRERGLWWHDVIRTAYGFGSEKTLVNDADASQDQLIKALYNRLEKTCQNMRKEGITVYTITLDPTMSAAAKTIYRNCASTSAGYFDTPDAASLKSAFNTIADNLAGVRLVE